MRVSQCRLVAFLVGFLLLQGLVFAGRLPAPPGPPPPPSAPAGGEIAQTLSFVSVAGYGLWQMRRRRK